MGKMSNLENGKSKFTYSQNFIPMSSFVQIFHSIWIHGPTSNAPLYLCHHNQPLSTISINSIQFLEKTILIPLRRLCTPLWMLLNSSRIQNENLFLRHLDIIHTIATLIVFRMPLIYNGQTFTFIRTKEKKDPSITHFLVAFNFW
jgi:hypothetical protein